jgi:hypothetical protein
MNRSRHRITPDGENLIRVKIPEIFFFRVLVFFWFVFASEYLPAALPRPADGTRERVNVLRAIQAIGAVINFIGYGNPEGFAETLCSVTRG